MTRPGEVVEAAPAGAVVNLAVTSDATAAITIDELDGARLWPTLDGAREPEIIDLAPASAYVIDRRGAGFSRLRAFAKSV